MKAIVLAAGMGKRLRPMTNSIPKCLVKVNGKSILENTLEILDNLNIEETIVVVGYLYKKIIKKIDSKKLNMKISYVHNNEYENTNNIVSLLLGMEKTEGNEFIIIESDVFFDQQLIIELLNKHKNQTVFCIDKIHLEPNTMRVNLDKNENIVEISRDITTGNIGRYIGIAKISGDLKKEFLKNLERLINEGKRDIFYDIAINYMPGVVKTLDISNVKWHEIDTIEDLRKAEKIFN